ncbi:MAG: Gfo/Idh/MocA family oxidoreductase [Butyrivibrio sp.]|nr:Gfo/Idh/MocA family oxidoreductase [Butyrivibrio sp.]
MKVAIMGTGQIAEVMAKTLKETRGVTCYAVGSRSMESATRFASAHGIKKAYGSYEELVNDPKVSLVYVATPHSEHYENVKLALSAGKHVICEKAFMLNEKQAGAIFKYAEEQNLLLTEAMWTRYMPMRSKLMEILSSNVIGEPTMLTANLGYNIAYKDRINRPELGGGALLDLGVYVLNFASMVFGNDVTDIASICTFNEHGMDMHDSITLRYADGKMAVLNATALSISDRMGIIYGSKGYIVVENINNFEGIGVYDSEYRKIAYYRRPKQKTGYEYEIEACVRAINEGWLECPEMPHSESLKIMNMMDFIRKSNHIVFPGEEDFASESAGEGGAVPAAVEAAETAAADTEPATAEIADTDAVVDQAAEPSGDE